ncbi:hypothetical protein ACPVPU_15355 [Sphingomonas sp. CJ99]
MTVTGVFLALLAQAQALSFPIKWDVLPPLPYRSAPVVTPDMSGYVAGEMQSGRCPPAPLLAGRRTIRADVAVLIDDEGLVRATIPRAIKCATVEQYAAGIVASAARNNLLPRAQGAPGWYRASVIFDWAG